MEEDPRCADFSRYAISKSEFWGEVLKPWRQKYISKTTNNKECSL